MSARKTSFAVGEFYHVFNRGVDKRIIFSDTADLNRFFKSMMEFNTLEPIGSIYEKSFQNNPGGDKLGSFASKFPEKRLVNFIAYCINPNHYHFILEQIVDNGIEKFMQRLGTGYTKYFNNKHKRSGALFQGVFKAVHIDSNEQLLHVSAYVNLNDRAHQLGSFASKLIKSRSSWNEYLGEGNEVFCRKDIILEQYKNRHEYKDFAESSLEDIIARKELKKELEELLLE